MNKYLTEFIGAFFLVATIGFTAVNRSDPGLIAPLAIGSALMVMIYAGGHISGGHYNPAVTLGVYMRGKMPTADVVPYWVAQILGAIVAALIVRFVNGAPTNPPQVSYELTARGRELGVALSQLNGVAEGWQAEDSSKAA